MSAAHRLFHVRPLEDATKPVSVAHQTSRRLCVHAQLDPGQNGNDALSDKRQSPQQRQVETVLIHYKHSCHTGRTEVSCTNHYGPHRWSAQIRVVGALAS